MQPDTVRRLQQLQRQAAQFGRLAHDLAAAAPRWSQGGDATGWVRIVLGPDGLPTQIRIRNGWQQHLEPERLGSAVLDANSDALRHATQAWTDDLDRGHWRYADVDQAAGPETTHGAASPFGPSPGRVRDMNDFAEEVLAALQAAQRPPTTPPPPDEEGDDPRPVTVDIGSGGLTACEIDPTWAARRSGAAVSAALSGALQRAKAKRPAVSSPHGEIDNLADDALATLTAFTRLQTTEGGDR